LGELWTRLPEFAKSAEAYIAQSALGRTLLQLLPDAKTMFDGLTAGSAVTAATATLGVLANVLIVVFLGVFFALTPRLYARGFVALFPPAYRPRVEDIWRNRNGAARMVAGTIRRHACRGTHHLAWSPSSRCAARSRPGIPRLLA
ncbi:MAG TPA: hypothetical protein VFP43_10310, partial [Mesorhizobium sp.]|nr:hypothetical protein [Mesorhizobium sp.]